MSEGGIVSALNQKLTQLSGFDGKIQFQNDRDFKVPANGLWLKQSCSFIPPAQLGSGIAGHYRLQGMYEVHIHVPLNSGMIAAWDLARTIVQLFRRGTTLNSGSDSVSIEAAFHSSEIETADAVIVPVTVQFFSYQPY